MDDYSNRLGAAYQNGARVNTPTTKPMTALDVILDRLSRHRTTLERLSGTVAGFNERVQGLAPAMPSVKADPVQPMTGIERIAAALADVDAVIASLDSEIDRLGSIA